MRLLLLALLVTPTLHAATPLQSPWDLHPPQARPGDYPCPALPALPRDILTADYYSDKQHSIIDPARKAAYDAATAPFHATTAAAERAADTFTTTGNRAAATCAATLLATNARAHALTGTLSTNQSAYVQGWTLGALATVWLKVRPAFTTPAASDPDTTSIAPWLDTVAHQTQSWFNARRDRHTEDSRNNHLYWAGFAVMAAGIAADDRPAFDFGEFTFREAARQIQPDGTLPLEMGRGRRALHYHLFALAPLVSIAELAAANHHDLYPENANALARLVDRTVAGLLDPTFFATHAGVAQESPTRPSSEDLTPLRPYARRFPNPQLSALLADTPLRPVPYLGGLPPP